MLLGVPRAIISPDWSNPTATALLMVYSSFSTIQWSQWSVNKTQCSMLLIFILTHVYLAEELLLSQSIFSCIIAPSLPGAKLCLCPCQISWGSFLQPVLVALNDSSALKCNNNLKCRPQCICIYYVIIIYIYLY